MEKGSKNKMMKEDEGKEKFFYPQLNRTIEADSKEEADKIAAKHFESEK